MVNNMIQYREWAQTLVEDEAWRAGARNKKHYFPELKKSEMEMIVSKLQKGGWKAEDKPPFIVTNMPSNQLHQLVKKLVFSEADTTVIGSTWSNIIGILLTNAFSIIGTIMGVKYASKEKN